MNILTQADLDKVIDHTKKLGGNVSYKSNEDGSQSPYELNINYLDALKDPNDPEEPVEKVAQRFLATQSIMLSLRGVPGIYFHSLFGSQNWQKGVEETGRFRTINREKLDLTNLVAELSDPQSIRHFVYQGFTKMLKARCANSAFHPLSDQEILFIERPIFALIRTSLDNRTQTLCLHNVTNQSIELEIDLSNHLVSNTGTLKDLLGEGTFNLIDSQLKLTIAPYQVLWLQP